MEFRKVLMDSLLEKTEEKSLVVHKVEYLRKDEKLRVYLSAGCDLKPGTEKIISEEIDRILGVSVEKDISLVTSCGKFEDSEDAKKLIMEVFKNEPLARGFFRDSSVNMEDGVITVNHYNSLLCTHMERKNVPELICQYCEVLFSKEVAVKICYSARSPVPEVTVIPEVNRDVLNTGTLPSGELKETVSVRAPQNTLKKELREVKKPNTTGTVSSEAKKDENVLLGKNFSDRITDISELIEGLRNIAISGEIFKTEDRELRNGKFLKTIYVYDGETSITAKCFLNTAEEGKDVKAGIYAKLKGSTSVDLYSKELTLMANHIVRLDRKEREDTAPRKRIELHAHTVMSSMDAVTDTKKLIKTAIKWGHDAVAVTDHGVVQAYPDAMDTAGNKKEQFIKVIYGMEAYLVDDTEPIVTGDKNVPFTGDFVVFDIETTGFSNLNDRIIEIGAVKVSDGKITERFSSFVNPERPLPNEIIELTKITDSMVRDEPTIDKVLPEFLKFCGDDLLVAHNADFDMGFIRRNAQNLNIDFKNEQMDTVPLARFLMPELKRHRLDTIAKKLGIPMGSHHRAVDDAQTTAVILMRFFEKMSDMDIEDTETLNLKYKENFDVRWGMPSHCVILARNQKGLKTIYELVSESHLSYFYRTPRILKSRLEKVRENLLLGSACSSGDLYQTILSNRDEEHIVKTASFYDYLEVMPIRNNGYLMEEGRCTEEELKDHVKYIINLGGKLGKPVVATGDVHMMDFSDEPYRRIIKYCQGFSGKGSPSPALPFLTTDEMLKDFDFLPYDIRNEIVIDNTHKISDMIEPCIPIPYETFPPKMDGAEEEVRNMTFENAWKKYGKPLPEIVQKRIDRELDSIIGNGYAVLYLVAHKLVKKSLDDGYLVGSRGSVGSSLAATFTDITEVNGLPAHYICPECKYSEFITDGTGASGVDLPPKDCPHCGTPLGREGHDIPFETFLGFEGDKEPDIDLNFSGEYQPVVHKYCEELFGKGFVFRAGTIGTVAEKTAMGYVRKYHEEKNLNVNRAEMERLAMGLTGIKRTTGQHPGGIMVVPSDNDIHNFCPVQRPADDTETDTITTHFDYHSISGRLLKLDILGHDDPTVLRMLQDITGIDPTTLPLNDLEVISIFTGTKALGVTPEDLGSPVGTYGIPEFGTKFVRQMLVDTQPKNFSDLVRISGLSHGTDVWLNNAQYYIANGDTDLAGCISLRDNIMIYLISCGLPPKDAFFITEHVRKGKGLKPEEEEEMRSYSVPEWYIESCKKIKYMFPKGHAVAYVTMAVRIAWFKVHMPLHYYATYFSVRAKDFDAELVMKGEGAVKARMDEIVAMGNDAPQKDQVMINVFEIVYEMFKRGFTFQNVDIYRSHPDKFLIEDNSLIPPLNAVNGVADAAAKSIAEAAKKGEFMSKEDFKIRTGSTKTVMEALENIGCFKGMGETNQISFF